MAFIYIYYKQEWDPQGPAKLWKSVIFFCHLYQGKCMTTLQ